MNLLTNHKRSRSVKAVSPAISTVILANAIIVTMFIALTFANNILSTKTAESDFNSAKQFMQTIGLQIDDVAWTIGRTETIRFSSKYGQMELLPQALKYTVKYEDESGMHTLVEHEVGVLLFNVPVSQYSVSDDYYRQIFPSSNAFIQTGAYAPVVRVFAVEWLQSGGFVRVVVAPCMRLINSTIGTPESKVFYTKLYLPVLTEKASSASPQSITLKGDSVDIRTVNNVTRFRVELDFPKQDIGFNNSFFHFPTSLIYEKAIAIAEHGDSVLELYASSVIASFGAQS